MHLTSIPRSASQNLLSACVGSGSGVELPPLWMMLVAQLDGDVFEFTPQQIAKLFRVEACDVREHCRELWPGRRGQGQWSLEFDQAAIVIYRMARRTRKLDPRTVLEDLKASGLTGGAIKAHHNVTRAHRAILVDRDRRAGLGK